MKRLAFSGLLIAVVLVGTLALRRNTSESNGRNHDSFGVESFGNENAKNDIKSQPSGLLPTNGTPEWVDRLIPYQWPDRSVTNQLRPEHESLLLDRCKGEMESTNRVVWLALLSVIGTQPTCSYVINELDSAVNKEPESNTLISTYEQQLIVVLRCLAPRVPEAKEYLLSTLDHWISRYSETSTLSELSDEYQERIVTINLTILEALGRLENPPFERLFTQITSLPKTNFRERLAGGLRFLYFSMRRPQPNSFFVPIDHEILRERVNWNMSAEGIEFQRMIEAHKR